MEISDASVLSENSTSDASAFSANSDTIMKSVYSVVCKKMANKPIKVIVLEGDPASLTALRFPMAVSLQLQ